MYHLATSKVCLADTYIIPISVLKHKKSLTIIELCHGIGNIKKFGHQILKKESGKGETISKLMNMHGNYDYVITTSEETNKFYSEAFNMPIEKMIPIGNPKIDYILKIKDKKKQVLKKYPKLKDKPVILYVSTFRRYNDDYLKKFVDNALLDKYNVIINIHPVTYKYHPDIDKFITDDRIYRCPEFNTQELLSVADIAITDYSSFVFESSILEIPTYLYVPDYDKYVSKNGLNVDIFKELPNVVFKDAKKMWEEINKNKYDKKIIRDFKNKYVSNCDGDATKKLVDFMIDKMR
jgi:CDP-ribitol ribitolphosphotransferase